ncbi:MAG: UvrD-helicase domain-containing protein [Ktedonobacterales bacterium]
MTMPSEPTTSRSDDLLRGLNPPQRKAVTTTEGPLLVLAGPGSGKTRVITHRIAYILQERRVSPWNVLAVTFTNKAAREMKERLETLIGAPARDLAVGTFHAICARILRRDGERAGIGLTDNFAIYDDDDQLSLVRQVLKEMNLDEKQFKPSTIHAIISRAKNDLLSPAQYAERVNKYFEEVAARVYKRYEELLRANNAADFDDLILLTYQLWRRNPDILKQYQTRYQYIHVDEFQDTNKAQYELVRLLAGGTPETPGHQNICAVADDDQCLVEGTLITLADGSLRPIEAIVAGDKVLSAHGSGTFRPTTVLAAAKRERTGLGVKITTSSGHTLISTPEHIHFAGYRLGATPQIYFTYIMHKRSVGYRLGTSQVYTNGQVKPVVGFMQRARHEHADAVWVLSAHDSENEARFEEYILSLRYRIPTLPFVPRKGGSVNGLVHDARYITRVFAAFDTTQNAHRLLADSGHALEFPHFRPRSRNSNRLHVMLTLCADNRGSSAIHRISLVGNDPTVRTALELQGFHTTVDKVGVNSWTYDAMSTKMAVLLERAERICQTVDADIIFNARLGKNSADVIEGKSLPFIPASSVRPGMVMFDEAGGYDVVERVETVTLDAPVYDLDIERTHNFIANGIVTHNSIYSWRGANPKVLIQFEQDFPNTQIVLLEQNYRSTQVILDAAQGVVQQNRLRKDKKLWTEKSGGEKITLHEAYNEEEEASFVVNEIRRLVARGDARLRDIAVMYRTNAQSRALEEQFIRTGTPYVVVGSKKFYERKEIKDVLAYLRLIANPLDTVSLQRVINVPNRKIGPKTVSEFTNWAQAQHLTQFEALSRIEEHPTLATAGKRALAGFYALLTDLRQAAREEPLPRLVDRLLERSGYAAELKDGTDEGEERWNNVLELRRVAEDFSEISPDIALALFLENVALVAGADTTSSGENGTLVTEEKDAATLITLHAAKGLEYPVVFIIGMEEGVLPHMRSLESQSELEEERRLAYVGITRAMRRLYLTRAFRRSFYGGNSVFQEASRFLEEIPAILISATRQRVRTGAPAVGVSSGRSGGNGSLWGSQGGSSRSTSPSGSRFTPSQPATRTPVGTQPAGRFSVPDFDTPAPTTSTTPAAQEVKLQPGDRVMHRLFGDGTVLKVSEERGSTTVEVLFKTAGKKTLDLSFANLTKI